MKKKTSNDMTTTRTKTIVIKSNCETRLGSNRFLFFSCSFQSDTSQPALSEKKRVLRRILRNRAGLTKPVVAGTSTGFVRFQNGFETNNTSFFFHASAFLAVNQYIEISENCMPHRSCRALPVKPARKFC